jgi:uncharacterized protein involved in response to NO
MLVSLPGPTTSSSETLPLFRAGFRPFFLLAGLSACLLLLLWGMQLSGAVVLLVPVTAGWHGHEMIFGYGAAVIAGFLLTAVQNWTGLRTLDGTGLMLLAAWWLLGRLLPLVETSLPDGMAAAVDLSFLPMLALAIAIPVVKKKNYRNLVFILILLLLTGSNLLYHLGERGALAGGPATGLLAGTGLILLLISVMGGRVIPFFIERGLGVQVSRGKHIDLLANLSMIPVILLLSLGYSGWPSATVMLLAALIHAIRLAGWYRHAVWPVSLLWVLVAAYAWLVIGLLLVALASGGLYPVSLALHALTIGVIAQVTLGMMVRVSMGHSGRAMQATLFMGVAFAALNVAVVVRIFIPVFMPDEYIHTLLLTIAIWLVAYVIFCSRIIPICLAPRADGRPG